MSEPQQYPSRGRAFVCLLLNLIVYPGLGTLVSGDTSRRRTGLVQSVLGGLLLAVLVALTVGGAVYTGDLETAKAWLGNILLLLVLWNVITGIQIFREAWRRAKSAPPVQ
jgi:hypothetical protein